MQVKIVTKDFEDTGDKLIDIIRIILYYLI